MSGEIARLLVQLDEVKPPVRRRVEVPLAIRLDNLHLVIQAAMGWENYHLYEFRTGRDTAYGVPDPDWADLGPSCLPAKQASLAELLKHASGRTKAFTYVYDFGDNWRHTVKLEAITAAEPDTRYPRLVSAERACPPEDVGGPWGYADFLEALADPAHERHDEMLEWSGEAFDPAAVDETAIRTRLSALASRMTKRAAPKACRAAERAKAVAADGRLRSAPPPSGAVRGLTSVDVKSDLCHPPSSEVFDRHGVGRTPPPAVHDPMARRTEDRGRRDRIPPTSASRRRAARGGGRRTGSPRRWRRRSPRRRGARRSAPGCAPSPREPSSGPVRGALLLSSGACLPRRSPCSTGASR